MEKTVEQVAQEINEKLAGAASKADLDALKNEISTAKEAFSNAASKEQLDKLDADIQKAFEKLNGLETSKNKSENQLAQFEVKKNVRKVEEGSKGTEEDYKFSGTIKADNIHNLFVISGGTYNADEANADTATLTITGGTPRFTETANSNLEFINTIAAVAEPILIGQSLQEAIDHDTTGGAEVVNEANTKPKTAVKVKIQKVEAKTVAVIWLETLQFINRMGIFRTFLQRAKQNKYINKLANLLMTEINAVAAAWSLPTGFNLVASPNNYDALTALAAFIEASKNTPTHVIINVIDMANMFTTKGLDGHYALTNGGSIQVINNGTTLIVNGSSIRVLKVDSNIQAVGTVTMFDVNILRFGLSPQIDASTNPFKYWEENIVAMRLESAMAVLKPENHPNAVVSATFEDIITDITAPEPQNGGGGSE